MDKKNIGGYPYIFVDAPQKDDYCIFCQLPAQQPMQGMCECGNLYCKTCLDEKQQRKECCLCGTCHKPLDAYPDHHNAIRISNLRVKCPSPGCPWIEKLNCLEKHIKECSFALLPCRNQCGESVLCSNMQIHLSKQCSKRQHICPKCNEEGTYLHMTTDHLNVCPTLNISTPSASDNSLNTENHKQTNESVPADKPSDSKIATLSGNANSSNITEVEVSSSCCKNGSKVIQAAADCNSSSKKTTSHVKLKDDMNKDEGELLYKAADADQEEVSDCPYKDIGCDFKSNVKQMSEHVNTSVATHLHLAVLKIREYKLWFDVWESRFSTNMSDYRTLKSSHQVLEGFQQNHVFSISSFEEKKTKNFVEWYSPEFYSHVNGYKFCVRVYANGNAMGRGTHVSAYLYFMKGVNDDNLQWPVKYKLTITLLNQIKDDGHLSISGTNCTNDLSTQKVSKGISGHGWGWPKFIAHDQLGLEVNKQCQYLMNDCLWFKVRVEILPECKPWLTKSSVL